MSKETLGVLASGRGSNFQAILDHIKLDALKGVEVGTLVSDNADAQALEIAEAENIPNYVVEPRENEPHCRPSAGILSAGFGRGYEKHPR